MVNRTLPWARIYNIFDPFSPLVPGQIDKLFVERPHSPLARLRYELGPDHLPQRMLLVGHPSSGKSTELARLGQTEPAVLRSLWRLLSLKRSREVILYPNWKTKDLEWTQGPAYDAFFAALWALVEKLAVDDGRE
jgi:hypothetical protein